MRGEAGRFGVPLALLLLGWALPSRAGESEARALAYLAREVPLWRAEHACGSCHNNGDAARALLQGRSAGYPVADAALASTLAWLSDPDLWEEAPGEPGTADLVLARVQFGAALRTAVETGALADTGPLRDAARRIAGDQSADGAWRLAQQATLGSPVTWGPVVATWQARRTLLAADPERHAATATRAEAFLSTTPLSNAMDAAAVLLALQDARHPDAPRRRAESEAWLAAAQTSDGGWGPWPGSAPEVFDTALALLALARHDADAHREAIARGRAFLTALQLGPGGWPETTRPAGYLSYAQHISTSGWATLALLETAQP